MMSKKCKYAFKALTRLAQLPETAFLQTAEVARLENIPKKFLESIFLEMKKAGIVSSKQGAGGGYYLRKRPNEISLAEVYRLMDGAIAMLPCVSEKYYEKCEDCTDEIHCTLKKAFADIREQTYELMQKQTIADLIPQIQS